MGDEHDDAFEAAVTRARGCTRCPELVAARTRVVVGTGRVDADVLLVGEAPTPADDALDGPVSGRAGRLLERGLAAAGLGRADVWTTTLVKCLPPAARAPAPAEVANCAEHLDAQLEAVRPVVVVALGGFVTKVLRGSPAPIRARRGREEPRLLGGVPCWLLPVFSPAAALYDAALADAFVADLARLPELLSRGRPELEPPAPPAEAEAEVVVAGPGQLGLF